MFFRAILLLGSFSSLLFGSWFVNQWEVLPPTLDQSIEALLKVDCQKVKQLRGLTPNLTFKGEEAVKRCFQEQRFLKAVFENDVQTYRRMLATNEYTPYFLFFSTFVPRFEITPLMVAVVGNAQDTFNEILQESGKIDFLKRKPLLYDINSEIYDDYKALGSFRLGNQIYDVKCIKALDLAAMYHRYEMFESLLKRGAEYSNSRCPQNNGVVAFGDIGIFELMLAFDPSFLHDFAGGHILHYAAKDNNTELIEYLVKVKGVPIDSLKAAETSLDVALSGRNIEHKARIEAAKKLIELGAKISERNQRRIQKLIKQGYW